MKISAYFTTRNCVQMRYPFEKSIRSVFKFSDEVVVCDTSDGTDETKERLEQLKEEFSALNKDGDFKIVTPDFVDWSAPNSGIYDGLTKAYARSQCTGDLCWQQDVDEVASDNTEKSWLVKIAEKLIFDGPGYPVIAFPVVEPWGSKGKIRCDINPWKERLTINNPVVTHGIPSMLKVVKEDGLTYAKPKTTDGCNLINKTTGYPVSCIPIYDCFDNKVLNMGMTPDELDRMISSAKFDNEQRDKYEEWMNQLIDKVPFVWHYSWYSVEDKIYKYKHFWANSWDSLYGEVKFNPPGFPFFNIPWDEVTDEQMKEMGEALEEKTGGHIFHSPWDGVTKTNHISLTQKAVPNPWKKL